MAKRYNNNRHSRPQTLISLSGGQDSTYVLWKHLTTEPANKVLVHHVNLRHEKENRLKWERAAVHNILDWLEAHGLDNFDYHESTFDYGTLPRISVKDIQVVAMFQAIILKTRAYDSLRYIKLPWHRGEVSDNEDNQGFRIKKLYAALEVTTPYQLQFPIKDMTRAQMAAEMPAELLALCHCCRCPDERGTACGKCKTCGELKDAGITLRPKTQMAV